MAEEERELVVPVRRVDVVSTLPQIRKRTQQPAGSFAPPKLTPRSVSVRPSPSTKRVPRDVTSRVGRSSDSRMAMLGLCSFLSLAVSKVVFTGV